MPQEAVKVSPSALRTLLGLEPTKTIDPSQKPDSTAFMSRFTPAELKARLNQIFVPSDRTRSDTTPAGIIPYLTPIHKEVGEKRLNIEKMKALSPELEQSRILVSSSIMSPNDLQDGEFTFTFDNVPGIEDDPELAAALAQVYDDHFNKLLKWSLKSYDWIGDIQYKQGAVPILLLPQATVDEVRNRTMKDVIHDKKSDDPEYMFGPGMADFFGVPRDQAKGTDNDDFLYSEQVLTWREVLSQQRPSEVLEELVPSMESFGLSVPTKYRTESRASLDDAKYGDMYVAGMEDMIVNLRKKLEEGDVIRVSENPEIVKFGTIKSLKNKQAVYEKLSKKYLFDRRHYPVEEGIVLNANPKNYKHHGHPIVMELPVESVIPIYVPGAPSEHLGYFILLDNFGRPLTIEASGMGDTGGTRSCSPGDASAAYEAVFGSNCARSFSQKSEMTAAGSMIFESLLNKYIFARIKGIIGRDDVSLSRFNAIATVMFQRLMEHKKTVLLYVPTSMLHYLAFDYRKNGTGTSKPEEAMFLLSLRTTLLCASLVAMINDSIEKKKIEIGVDEKEANLEGVMDLVANIFIERNKLTGSIDPSEIMRDIYSNSLTIVPKNVPGLQDLSVEVTNGNNGQSTRADSELLDKLSELLLSHYDVPPAALNSMNEPEFARSLTTYNLFFAKKITRYQNIYCGLMAKLIQDYTFFSPPFQRAITKILDANGKKRMKDKLPPSAEKLKDKDTNNYERDLSVMADMVLSNVEVHLPRPRLVVDKTQFEEIRQFMGNLDEISNRLFDNEMIPSDDSEAANGMTVARATWRRQQIMNFLTNIGRFDMVDMPDFDEIDHEEIISNIQVMQNLNKHLTDHRNNIGNSMAEESGGFGDSYGSDDTGMGGDFGESGGDEMSMDDMGSMEEPDMSMETEESETSESSAGAQTTEGQQEEATSTASLYLDLNKKKRK